MVQRVLNDRYELRSMLGRGGMAEVWQGFDRRLGRMVAVKVLHQAGLSDPSVSARFDREARTAAALAHPNIVAVHDVGADDGVSYLVMELIQGRDLAERLAGGPLDVAEAVGIAIQVCAALEAAGAAGAVHRDVKPANILITDAGEVKVCDFGIARAAGTAHGSLTGSAQMIGTSAYMAPEQVTGDRVDARTDLYGLGCVLYAMLTGHPPFTGDNPLQIAWHHLERTPEPASTVRPGLPADLDRLVQALLAKRPSDRPGTPGQVRAALQNLDLGPASLPLAERTRTHPEAATAVLSAPTRTMPPLAGAPAVLAIVAGIVVVGVVAVILLTRPGGPEPQAAPPAGTAPTAAATATDHSTAPAGDGSLAGVQAVITAQVRAGNLDGETARELSEKLDEIGRESGEGDSDKAAEKVADLLKKLDEWHGEDKLSDPAYDAVVAELQTIEADSAELSGD